MAYENSTHAALDMVNKPGYYTEKVDINKLLEATKSDPVNAPNHYLAGRSIEPIAVIEDWKLDYHLGNALKYIARAGRKDDLKQDLEKSIWYLKRKIECL